MKEQLISYETAVLIKERGYKPEREWNPEYVKGFIVEDNDHPYIQETEFKEEDYNCPGYYLQTTQSILQKWLREVHKIDVLPILRSSGKYSYDIYHYDTPNKTGERTRYPCMNSWSSFEDCLESGLQEALKLIKI